METSSWVSPVAVVTGGGGALGSTVARALVDRGARVALLDVERAKDRLAALTAELGPERAIAQTGDFATADAWKRALEAVKQSFGSAPEQAALVAGGWDGGAPLFDPAMTDDRYEKMMRANVDTVWAALRALLPPMVAARRGSVVVVGSRVVERPWTSAGAAAYAASKSAAVALARAAAEEVLPHGVRINAIMPSTMDTPANRAAMPSVDPATWVTLDSAAGVIAFLLSDGARDVSGAAVPVYGRA
jgi:NAD(P)-dependent dehydrogenase (short-subunit alcohol dehydrogenase family)